MAVVMTPSPSLRAALDRIADRHGLPSEILWPAACWFALSVISIDNLQYLRQQCKAWDAITLAVEAELRSLPFTRPRVS